MNIPAHECSNCKNKYFKILAPVDFAIWATECIRCGDNMEVRAVTTTDKNMGSNYKLIKVLYG